MCPAPAERPSPDRPQGGESQSERDERFGALTIARVVKEDGRALILYTHEERERT